MLLVGASGVLKLLDLAAFREAVNTWTVVPYWLRVCAVVLVPTGEVVACGLYLIGLGRGWAKMAAAACIVLYTGTYVWQWVAYEAPDCGCLGLASLRMAFLENSAAILIRNISMVIAISAPAIINTLGARCILRPNEPSPSDPVSSRGFSLIEVLLIIALVGILASLIAPSLSGVRDRATSTASMANLGSHARVFQSYATDYQDTWPCFVYPEATRSVIRCESADIAVEVMYFTGTEYWNVALADAYYAGDWRGRSFQSPRFTVGEGSRPLHYQMACGLIADPAFFEPERRVYSSRQLRATRVSEVLYPSLKGILVEIGPGDASDVGGLAGRGAIAATSDGRAASFRPEQLTHDEYPEGSFAYTAGLSTHLYATTPMLHTKHGVRGRDLKN